MSGDNKLALEIDDTDAKSKIQSLKAELAQLIQQAQTLKTALADTTGGQKSIAQGALAGVMGRIGSIQSSLGTAQQSSVIGGAAANPTAGLTGAFAPTMLMPAPMQQPTIQPMNPGTLNGVYGGGGGSYVPTIRFATGTYGVPGGSAAPTFGSPYPGPSGFPTVQMGAGGGNPSPASMGMDTTIQFTPAQFSAANYGPRQAAYARIGLGAAYGVARSAGDFFNYQAERSLSGGDDPTARARGIAGGISTAIGVGVGIATENPMLGLAAAGIAGTVLDPMARWWAAPEAAGQSNNMAVRGFFGSYYGIRGANSPYARSYSQNTNLPGSPGTSRFARLAQLVDPRLPAELQFGNQGAGLGEVFGNVAGSLLAGGIDPMKRVGSFAGTMYPWWNIDGRTPEDAARDARKFLDRSQRGFAEDSAAVASGRKGIASYGLDDMIRGMAAIGEYDIKRRGMPYSEPDETIAGRYTRRLATLFGTEAKDQAKRVGSIFSTLPETGSNIADILTRFGPQDTLTYLRLQNDEGTSSVDPMTLSRVSAGMRASDRAVRLGGLRPLGSGAAQKEGYARKMLTIAGLGPEALDSEAFAQSYAGYRGARAEEFEQGTLSGYGLRDVQLSERRRRLDVLPFAPGNIMGVELESIVNRRGQISRLGGMLANKDLSERERYGYTAERERLITANYESAAVLSEGFENRLPALHAGQPAFFSRYNSLQGAAVNLGLMGSPIRAYGAANGRQASAQQAFISALGGDAVSGAHMPYSRTSEMNTPILQDIASSLKQLVAQGSSGGGARVAGGRPMDGRNSTAAGQDSKQLPDPNHHPY